MAMARGDWERVKSYWRKILQCQLVNEVSLWWVETWLDRLEKDPNWPSWIKNPKQP